MSLLIRLVLSLSLLSSGLAYPAEPAKVLQPQDVRQIFSRVKTMAQVFKLLEAFSRPREFAEVRKFLAERGVTEASRLPQFSIEGTRLRFAGLKGSFDVRNLARGRIDNGLSAMSFNPERKLLENVKATAEFLTTGAFHASLFDVLVPRARAESSEPGPSRPASAAGLLFDGVAVAAVITAVALTLTLSVPAILTAIGLTAFAALLVTLADAITNSSARRKQSLQLSCENGLLIVQNFNGMDTDLTLEDYAGPIELRIRNALCREPKALKTLNTVIENMGAAKSAATATATEAEAPAKPSTSGH